ncbi:MAG: hypothetical protein M9953_04100 [Thermomicrobiales bacterium]|nr:hypothetical protein [Thermomicrobiales bacterium]MCO5224500.1 hypothetical protein [Thermomicrobiales bacterium]
MAGETLVIECLSCSNRKGLIPGRPCPSCGVTLWTKTALELAAMGEHEAKSTIAILERIRDERRYISETEFGYGQCLLRLGLWKKALERLEASLHAGTDDSDCFFYCSIASLYGNRPRNLTLPSIRTAEQYLMAALRLREVPVYYLLFAYIRHDYYEEKSLRVEPSWKQYLEKAKTNGATSQDVNALFQILGREIPKILQPT